MSTSDGIAGLINTAQKIWEDERTRGRQVVTVCLDTASCCYRPFRA